MLNTGLIQPETIPGHFPRNLRTIVELYRSCLDGGADLVLCPPLALSGVYAEELALRSGFLSQHRAALAYLAREIAEVPLLLGAADAEGIRFHLLRNGLSFPRQAVISPAAYGTGTAPVFGIQRTEDEPGFSITPWQASTPLSSPCLLFRTPSTAWHEGLLEQDEEEGRRLARETALPVFTARLAGGEGPFMLPGASSAWSGSGVLLKRLRLFERDSAVVFPENSMGAVSPLPVPEEQLRHALRRGTADFILKSGHGSVCLNLLESPAALLVAQLLKEELPSLPVTGFIPRLPGVLERDITRAQAWADKLDIQVRMQSFPADTAHGGLDNLFTAAWRMRPWAEEEGALLLSALNGTDIITAPRLLPAALAADFMPLGDFYETELANLFPGFLSPAPDAALRDSLLRRMHRVHESATLLAHQFPESEPEIRRWQRQARASEWMRRKLPPILILLSLPGAPETPYIHWLTD